LELIKESRTHLKKAYENLILLKEESPVFYIKKNISEVEQQ